MDKDAHRHCHSSTKETCPRTTTTCQCGQQLLKKNYFRHVRRWHQSESQLVEESRGGATQGRVAAEAAVTSSKLIVETRKPSQPVQGMHRTTSQKAASPAAHVKSRQVEEEKRGGSRSHSTTRRSSKSRSPARERHGYAHRDARHDMRSRSPRREERRATPRSSPGRRLPYESRRDERQAVEPPTSEETKKQLFQEFLSFIERRRE